MWMWDRRDGTGIHADVAKTEGSMAVPVIVTLHQDKINFIDKVPIVPIFQFSSFIDEFYGNIEQMNTIEKD